MTEMNRNENTMKNGVGVDVDESTVKNDGVDGVVDGVVVVTAAAVAVMMMVDMMDRRHNEINVMVLLSIIVS